VEIKMNSTIALSGSILYRDAQEAAHARFEQSGAVIVRRDGLVARVGAALARAGRSVVGSAGSALRRVEVARAQH
jgi:hypothetical protein